MVLTVTTSRTTILLSIAKPVRTHYNKYIITDS